MFLYKLLQSLAKVMSRSEKLVKVSEALAPVAASSVPGVRTVALGGLFHKGSACHRLWDAYGALLIILEMMSLCP